MAERDIFVGNVRVTFSEDGFKKGAEQVENFRRSMVGVLELFSAFSKSAGTSLKKVVDSDLKSMARETATLQGQITQTLATMTRSIQSVANGSVSAIELEIGTIDRLKTSIAGLVAVRGAENKIRQKEKDDRRKLAAEFGMPTREQKRAGATDPLLTDKQVAEFERRQQQIVDARNKAIQQMAALPGLEEVTKAFYTDEGEDRKAGEFFQHRIDEYRNMAIAGQVSARAINTAFETLETSLEQQASKTGQRGKLFLPDPESVRNSMAAIRKQFAKDIPEDPFAGLTKAFSSIEKTLRAVGVVVTGLRGAIDAEFAAMVRGLQGKDDELEKAMIDPFAHAFDVLVGNSIIPDLRDRVLEVMGPEIILGLNRRNADVFAAMVQPFATAQEELQKDILPALERAAEDIQKKLAAVSANGGNLIPGNQGVVQEYTRQILLLNDVIKLEQQRRLAMRLQPAVPAPLGFTAKAVLGVKTALDDAKESILSIYGLTRGKPVSVPISIALPDLEQEIERKKALVLAAMAELADVNARNTANVKPAAKDLEVAAKRMSDLAVELQKLTNANAAVADIQQAQDALDAQRRLVDQLTVAYQNAQAVQLQSAQTAKDALADERSELAALIKQYDALAKVQDFSKISGLKEAQPASVDENPLFSAVGPSRLNNALLALKSGDFGWLRGVQELMSGANTNTSKFGEALDRVNKSIFDLRYGVSQAEGPIVSLAENMAETRENADNVFTTLIQNMNRLNRERQKAGVEVFQFTAFQRATTGLVREFDNVTSAIQANGKVSRDALQNYQQQLQQAEAAVEQFNKVGIDENGKKLQGLQEAEDQIALMRRQYELLQRAVAQEEKVEARAARNTQTLAGIFKLLRGAASGVLGIFSNLIGLTGRLAASMGRTILPIQGVKNALGSLVRIGGTAAIGGFVFNALNNLNDTVRQGAIESTNTLESFRGAIKAQLSGVEQDYVEVLTASGSSIVDAEEKAAARTSTVTDNIVEYIKKVTATTKFELADTIDAFQRILTAQLDPTTTFEPIANAATALNVPLEQIVGAFAALNAGDTGEGIARLRDANVNVNQLGLAFKKNGELATPVDEAVQKILKTFREAPQFAGAAAAGVNTLSGAFSNFFDTAKQLGVVALEPVFKKLKDIVVNVTGALDANELKDRALQIGETAAGVVERIGQSVSKLTPIFAVLKLIFQVTFGGFIEIGKAVIERIRHIIDGMSGLGSSFATTGKLGNGLAAVLFTIRESLRAVADLVRGDFGGAFARIRDVFEVIGLTLASFFVDLAPKAFNWAANIATSFADGFLEVGGQAITAAINGFGEIIAFFLRGFSPPKGGVLKDIDTWGRNLAGTFSEGFASYDPSGAVEDYGSKFNDAIGRLDLNQFELLDNLSSPINQALEQGLDAIQADQKTIATALQHAQNRLIEGIEAYSGGADAQATAETLVASIFGSIDGPLAELMDLVTATFEESRLDSVIAGLDDTIDGLRTAEEAAIAPLEAQVEDLQDSFDAAEEIASRQIESMQSAVDVQRDALESYEKQTDKMVDQAIRASGLFVSEAEIARVDAALDAAQKDVGAAEERLQTIREANQARGLTFKTFEELNAEAAVTLAKEREREAQAEKDKVDLKRQQADALEKEIRGQRQAGADALKADIEAREQAIEQAQKAQEDNRRSFDEAQKARKAEIEARKAGFQSQIDAAEAQKKMAEEEQKRLQEIIAVRMKAIQLRLDNEQAMLDAEEKNAKEKAAKKAGESARSGSKGINIPQLLLDQFGQVGNKAAPAMAKLTDDLNARIDRSIAELKKNARAKLRTFWEETVAKIKTSPMVQWVRDHADIIRRALVTIFAYFVAPALVRGVGRAFDLLLGGLGSLIKILPALSRAAILRTIFVGIAAALGGLFVAVVGKERALELFGNVIAGIAKEVAAFRTNVLETVVKLFRAFFTDAQGAIDPLKGLMSIIGVLGVGLGVLVKIKGFGFIKDLLLVATGLSPIAGIIVGVVAAVVLFRKEFGATFLALRDAFIALQPTFERLGYLLSGLVALVSGIIASFVALAAGVTAALINAALPAVQAFAKGLEIVANAITFVLDGFTGSSWDALIASFKDAGFWANAFAVVMAGLAAGFVFVKVVKVLKIVWDALMLGVAAFKLLRLAIASGGITTAISGFTTAIGASVFQLGLLGVAIAAIALAMHLFGDEMSNGLKRLQQWTGIGAGFAKEFDEIARSSKGVNKALDDVAKDREFIVDIKAEFSVKTDALDASLKAVEQGNLQIEGMYNRRKELVEKFSDLGEGAFDSRSQDGLSSEGRSIRNEYKENEAALIKLNAAQEKERLNLRDQANAQRDLKRAAFEKNLTYREYVESIHPGYYKAIEKLPANLRENVKAQEELNDANYEAEKAQTANTRSAEAVGRAQADLRDRLSNVLKDQADNEREYQSESRDAAQKYLDERAALAAEYQGTLTAEEQAAYDERLAALNTSFADDKTARDTAYAEEKARLQQHLAELLIETITAATERRITQLGLTQEEAAALRIATQGQIDTIAKANGLIDDNYTVLSSKIILATNNWVDSGSGDVKEFYKTLEDLGIPLDETTRKLLGLENINVRPNLDSTAIDVAHQRALTLDTLLNKMNGKEVSVKILTDILTGANLGGGRAPVKNPGGRVPMLATGTFSAQGGWSIVGEQGAELVYLPRTARVFKNSSTRDYLNNPDKFDRLRRQVQGRMQRADDAPLAAAAQLLRTIASRTNAPVRQNPIGTRSSDAMRSIGLGGRAMTNSAGLLRTGAVGGSTTVNNRNPMSVQITIESGAVRSGSPEDVARATAEKLDSWWQEVHR